MYIRRDGQEEAAVPGRLRDRSAVPHIQVGVLFSSIVPLLDYLEPLFQDSHDAVRASVEGIGEDAGVQGQVP